MTAIYIPEKLGMIIGVCPKAGSSSIINHFHIPGLRSFSGDTAIGLKRAGWKITAVIRHPIVRLESAFNFFRYGQCGDRFDLTTIEKFVDWVLDGNKNEHWSCQIDLFTINDELLPHKFVRIDSIGLDRIENKNEHIEKISNYRSNELRDIYRKDFVLWESLV